LARLLELPTRTKKLEIMKKSVLLVAFAFVGTTVFAQTSTDKKAVETAKAKPEMNSSANKNLPVVTKGGKVLDTSKKMNTIRQEAKSEVKPMKAILED
jgi:hypothetical protein